MWRRLLVLIQEPVVGPLRLLAGLDGYVIVLQDDFLEDLVQDLLLEAENWLATGDTYGFVNDKRTFFTQKDLLEVHTSEILFVTQIVSRDEVEELASA